MRAIGFSLSLSVNRLISHFLLQFCQKNGININDMAFLSDCFVLFAVPISDFISDIK